MDHYFALLWQFERVHAGRASLEGQQRLNGTRPVVKYLDSMIGWHVTEWASRWLEIRAQIKVHVPLFDDHHSLSAFCDLVGKVDPENENLTRIRAVINNELSARQQPSPGSAA
ncbi:hypothetical protein ACFC0S_00010 [Streptomyces sp. NPDC056084]|uniref:hypothetical protein n=1 Tax=unclassified Streptomyces TaxID=2593676 RepID=UPI0035D948D8